MILRFSSGSLTPARASRKRFSASTTCRSTPVAATKSRSTCSASPLRSRPWSTNTQVSRSPIARCTTAAATAESTPPDSPQMARPESPICSRMRSICSSTMFTIVQVGRQPAICSRKCSSTFWPCSVCSTSGCHCTPAKRRSVFSKAATGDAAVVARTSKPSGARRTESPCDIQTRCSPGMSARRVPGLGDADRCPAVLGDAGARDLTAERLGHRLEAVAHAEDGDVRVEQGGVDAGGARGVDRRRPAGEDDRGGLPGQHLRDRHGVRDDLGVDLGLAHPTGDQLGVLGSEIDDENEVVVGQDEPSRRASKVSTSLPEIFSRFCAGAHNPGMWASLGQSEIRLQCSLPGRISISVRAAADSPGPGLPPSPAGPWVVRSMRQGPSPPGRAGPEAS